jgi:uncharacterized metal-binding protein YceD (DUF177 family)
MSRERGPDWTVPVRLSELGRGPDPYRLQPDEGQRARIAEVLGLAALPAFSGEARLAPWHDGAEVQGRWTARVTYVCGLTLEPFDADLTGEFTVRAVPPSSPAAAPAPEGEVELDLEAEDPPDVIEGETVDLAHYLVEDLALALDPFPRKPGAVFEPPPAAGPDSAFAVLKRLKEP